jgi:hypothetical protein
MDQDIIHISNKVDNLTRFLQQNMVTKQEFDERFSEFPTREEFNPLQQSVDVIAKQFKDQEEERLVAAERSSRMEGWMTNAAKRLASITNPKQNTVASIMKTPQGY